MARREFRVKQFVRGLLALEVADQNCAFGGSVQVMASRRSAAAILSLVKQLARWKLRVQ